MADEWQRVVLPENVFLTDNFVYSARLRDILMAKKLLSPDDIEAIGLIKTTRERVHELIWKYLSKRGPGSLLKFIEALEEDNPSQSALAKRLRSRLSEGAAASATVSPSTRSHFDNVVRRRAGITKVGADRRSVEEVAEANELVGKYCIIKEGHFFISVRIYVPLAFTEGESKGNVVASLSCQCDEVTKRMDKYQRKLAGEPRECKSFQNDSISVDSMDEVELSVDPPQGTSALYSVSGKLSYSIPATALKLLIGEEHMKCSITRSFFLERMDSSKTISVNFTFQKKLTGSTVPFCIVMWRPMPRPGNLMLLSNGRPETHNEPIQRELQDRGMMMLDRVTSKDERIALAKKIRAKWRHVGEALGLEDDELDGFAEKKDDRDRAQAMLDAWAQKKHKNATRKMLILALKKEGYGKVISDVFDCDPDSIQPPGRHYATSV